MKTIITTYTVSIYNDTPINDINYRGESRYNADLFVIDAIKEKKHGLLLMTTITENKEFDYYNKEFKIIKEF